MVQAAPTDLNDALLRSLQTSPDPVLVWDASDGITFCNDGAASWFGVSAQDRISFDTLRGVSPEIWADVQNDVATHGEWFGDLYQTSKSGETSRLNARVLPVSQTTDGASYILWGRDLTRFDADLNSHKALFRDAKHRVANLFAVTQAILRTSVRDHPEAKEFARTLLERIRALTAGYTASLQNDADGSGALEFSDLATAVLGQYRSIGHELHMSGETVVLPKSHVTPISVILHEFATNAVKHGAWSVKEGRVDLGWRVTGDRDISRTVQFDWIEQAPGFVWTEDNESLPHFGTKLIESSTRQIGGTCERRFLGHQFCNSLEIKL